MSSRRNTTAPLLARARHPAALAAAGALLLALILGIALSGPDLPDLGAYPAGAERKAAFFDFLKPIVARQNAEILEERARLKTIAEAVAAGDGPSLLQRMRLGRLAERYGLDDAEPESLVADLLRRVDLVPLPLVLVQAAKESGWGTSRFAREANNLFGQWCYSPGCGIVPSQRAAGAKHEVRDFASVEESVAAYLRNINTGRAYRRLRDIRASQRRAGERPNPMALADGLLFYSQRREAYVNEVKRMIYQYYRFEEQRVG